METGRLISAIRQQRGLTQQQLAQRLGFTQGYQNHIETGYKHADKLTLGLLRRIAAALDVSLTVLTDEAAFRMVFGDPAPTHPEREQERMPA